MSLWSFKTKHL